MTTEWTLSGFGDEIDADPMVQVAVLQALGAHAIEVRSAWGVNVVDLDDDQLAGLHRIFDERGQGVSAIASPVGKVPVDLPVSHEVGRLERAVAAAHALGTTNIRIFSFFVDIGTDAEAGADADADAPADAAPRVAASVRDPVLVRMRALADVAEREGVTLLHENEKDVYGDVPSRVLDIVESVGSERLRLAWDNANYVQCGVKPFTEAWPVLGPYVDYLQVKDARSSDNGVVAAGEGDGELLETLTALRDRGYGGYASLEPHLDHANSLGGFSGPAEFGRAGRALRTLTDRIGVTLR